MNNNNEDIEFEEHLPTKSKIAYAMANTANGLLSGLGLGQINYFYTEKFHLMPNYVGLAWMIFAVWNAINDPLFGIIEDKTQSKLGRRIPYLRYGSIIYMFTFFLVWFPFAKVGDQIPLFLNLLLMLFIFDTLYSMIGLVTYSLPAEMAITSKERSSIMMYSTFIGFFGQVFGFMLPIIFLQGDNKSIPLFQTVMIITGVICFIIIYISSYYIKENKWAQKEPTLGFIDSIKETFKNKQFLIFEGVIFVTVITQNILMSGFLFLLDYVVNPLNTLSYLALGIVILILIASIIYFNKKIPKWGLKKTYIIGTIIGIFGFGLIPVFANISRNFEILAIPISLVMVGFGSNMLTSQPLMADCIDNDELLTGKRRETTYSGVNALITKPAISIANYIFFAILAIYGYNKNNPVQPPTVGDGVILAYSVVPVICGIIAILFIIFFKLDGPEWQEKKKMLHQKHIQKEKEYLEELKKKGVI
ncbi:MAG: MFS transporter [Promethearchaeota archaeon]